jgi:hypothetical protein
MFAPLMEARRSIRAALVVACAAAAAGCGGGERQDADEPRGDFKVEVAGASFPRRQSIADRSTLRVRVRNADTKTAPNVAVTIKTRAARPGGAPSAFGQSADDARFADDERPVWILDRGPEGGDTSYTNTWASGPLRPGQTKTFEWSLTAVEPGAYTLDYEVSPGLDGRAKLASGAKSSGSLKVRVDGKPAEARVGDDGEVLRDRPGSSSGSGGDGDR